MLNTKWIIKLETTSNILELAGVILLLAMAFIVQLVFQELPCPLCLLQRIGFLATATALLFNLRFGFRPSHYALILLSSLFTSFVALRQVALHIVPGSGAYGMVFFGLHLYTWSFIISMAIVVFTTFMLAIDRQYLQPGNNLIRWRWLAHLLFATVILLIVFNLISVVLECGFHACSDNPVRYELLSLAS